MFLLLFIILGYTTTRPAAFKLQDDGSAQAVEALRAVSGEYNTKI